MQVYPSQITPAQPFNLFYFIRNHTDSNTYYVQAVIYDSATGEILKTVPLTQTTTNSRLFAATTQAPADPQALGRNIVAIATVYTDSGYTTRSTDYEEQEQYFLVKYAPSAANLSGGIGGGGEINMRDFRDMMREEINTALAKLPAPKEFKVPDQPDMSFVDALFGTLGAITRELNRIPKDGPDLSGIIAKLDGIKFALGHLPKPDAVDLAPLIERLDALSADTSGLPDSLRSSFEQLSKGLQALLTQSVTDMGKELETRLTDVIESQEITIPVSRSARKNKDNPTSVAPAMPAHIM